MILYWPQNYDGIICRGCPTSTLSKLREAIEKGAIEMPKNVNTNFYHNLSWFQIEWQACMFEIMFARGKSRSRKEGQVISVKLIEWCV